VLHLSQLQYRLSEQRLLLPPRRQHRRGGRGRARPLGFHIGGQLSNSLHPRDLAMQLLLCPRARRVPRRERALHDLLHLGHRLCRLRCRTLPPAPRLQRRGLGRGSGRPLVLELNTQLAIAERRLGGGLLRRCALHLQERLSPLRSLRNGQLASRTLCGKQRLHPLLRLGHLKTHIVQDPSPLLILLGQCFRHGVLERLELMFRLNL